MTTETSTKTMSREDAIVAIASHFARLEWDRYRVSSDPEHANWINISMDGKHLASGAWSDGAHEYGYAENFLSVLEKRKPGDALGLGLHEYDFSRNPAFFRASYPSCGVRKSSRD